METLGTGEVQACSLANLFERRDIGRWLLGQQRRFDNLLDSSKLFYDS